MNVIYQAIEDKPRMLLQALVIEKGVKIDRPISDFSDDDCRNILRHIFNELQARDNIQ